jgi:hypothetical protein
MRTAKTCVSILGGCWVLWLLAGDTPGYGAEGNPSDFEQLKETVRQQGEQMRKMAEQLDQLQKAHAADQEAHQKDQEMIQQLQQKLAAQPAVTNVPPPVAAVEVAPMPRVPIDEATVNHNFSILGDAEFQYAHVQGEHPTFLFADFAPIFLYRGGDTVLFEAGFDFILQNNAPASAGYTTTINLSFAQLDYMFSDYATLASGLLLLPLGTYVQRSAGWLNKIPDDPLPRGLLPGNGVGAEVLGAVPLGQEGKMINYAVYGVNGPSSADGTGNAGALDLGGNVGLRSDNTVANLHANPSGGGRVGFFSPFKPHYDLEVGFSGQAGEWDPEGAHLWSAVVLDASVHLGSFIEAKGEYINSWYGSDDFGQVHANGWWLQAGYKLAGLNLEAVPRLSNVELMGRYDVAHDGLGISSRRYTVGFIYYFSNTLLFEGDYEFMHSNDPTLGDRFVFQLSYGF